MKKVWICFLLLALVFVPSMAFASIGHSVSHSSHSFSSHSSGSFSSHSSSSYGHSYSGSGSSSYSNSGITIGRSSGSGNSSFFGFIFLMFPFIFVLIFIFVIIGILKAKRNSLGGDFSYIPENRTSIPQTYVDRASIDQLKQKDPNFSEEAFLSKVGNMFIQLEEAWMHKQWNKIRPYETDALFNMHAKQLQDYINKNQTNVCENIAILNSEIVRFTSNQVNDQIDVKMEVRLNDYVIDDDTKRVVEGNAHQDIYMVYIFTLIRKNGVLTEPEKEHYHVTQCPNCGANVSINASGECEYCGSTISNGEHDWVLSKLTVISQN